MKPNTIITVCILLMICLFAGCNFENGKKLFGSSSESDSNVGNDSDHYVYVFWPDHNMDKMERPYTDSMTQEQFLTRCGRYELSLDDEGLTEIMCYGDEEPPADDCDCDCGNNPEYKIRQIWPDGTEAITTVLNTNAFNKEFFTDSCGDDYKIDFAEDGSLTIKCTKQKEEVKDEVRGLCDKCEGIPLTKLKEPTVTGSLDKRIIQKVVRQHANELRSCYERELAKVKGLNGRIVVMFIISSQGYVTTAIVKETTMKNKNVESCITNSIKFWRFPAPKGGGMAQVEYPFEFTPE